MRSSAATAAGSVAKTITAMGCVRLDSAMLLIAVMNAPLMSSYQGREMRHHMAVLLQANRYRRDDSVPAIYRMPDPKELGRAIDFAYRFIKVFSEL